MTGGCGDGFALCCYILVFSKGDYTAWGMISFFVFCCVVGAKVNCFSMRVWSFLYLFMFALSFLSSFPLFGLEMKVCPSLKATL